MNTQISLSQFLAESDNDLFLPKPKANLKGGAKRSSFSSKNVISGVLCCVIVLLFFGLWIIYQKGPGARVITYWTTGSSMWPDSSCPVESPFGNCNSNLLKDGNKWATQICIQNGFSSGEWSGRTKYGCGGQLAMVCSEYKQDDGHCLPSYRYGCLPNYQSQIEIRCKGRRQNVEIVKTGADLSTIGLDKELNMLRNNLRSTSKKKSQ